MEARVRRRLTVAPVIVGLIVVVGASVALAQEMELGGKLRAGSQVVIPAEETIDSDLYASGGLVRVEGTVDGDLIVTGGQVRLTGEVTGDLIASGGMVDVSGQVEGDVRAAGGQLTVSGTIGEDLFVAGGQVTLSSSGEVGEDLVFAAGQMTLDGSVTGDVMGSTGNYQRGGTVGGEENVTVSEDEEPTVGDRSLDAVQRFVSILVVAGLALWLAPRLIEAPAQTLRNRPLASLGVGLLGLVGFIVLVVAVILVAVLLAIVFGLLGLDGLVGTVILTLFAVLVVLGLLFFLTVVFGAPAGVGLSLGSLVMGSPARRWLALILGVLVVVILTSLPWIGGWLGLVVLVFGLGAIILALRPRSLPLEAPASMD